MKLQTLILTISSEWHIGSGEEASGYADALVLKTRNNLPYVPGKSIKGLFREAMQQGIENNWFQTNENISLIDALFGSQGQELTSSGALNFSSVFLAKDETEYFIQHSQETVHLYRVLYSTAIDSKTGSAKNHSLRALEVAIPMTLFGAVGLDPNHENYALLNKLPIAQWLQQASQLILNLGAKRHRGLGKVRVELIDLVDNQKVAL